MNNINLIKRAREFAKLTKNATEGPWYSIPDPEYRGACCRIDNKPDARWSNFGQICYTSPRNAPLIAAAPEMAELLKVMADRLEESENEAKEWAKLAKEYMKDLAEMARHKTL